MESREEFPFYEELKDVYEHVFAEMPLPPAVLQRYLQGGLAPDTKKRLDDYFASNDEAREDLERLKLIQLLEDKSDERLTSGSKEVSELPPMMKEALARDKSLPLVLLDSRLTAKDQLTKISPFDFRFRPLDEPGRYTVIFQDSSVTIDLSPSDLQREEKPEDLRRAAASKETRESTALIRTEHSADNKISVRIYPGSQRSDGTKISARLEITVGS